MCHMARVKTWLVVVAGVMAVALSAPATRASSFAVTPTVIELAPRAPTAVLTVENRGRTALRFQLSAYRWEQTPGGKPVYQPTEDLIFFPPLLTVGPGEKRLVRLGTELPFGTEEGSYRLFLSELPPLEKRGGAGEALVTVLTNVGVPVFLEPAQVTASGRLEDLRLQGGELAFSVKNEGNVRLVVLEPLVKGLDGKGGVTFGEKLKAGYVLAHGRLDFHTKIPAGDCLKSQRLAVTATVEEPATDGNVTDKRLNSEVTVAPGACAGRLKANSLKSL